MRARYALANAVGAFLAAALVLTAGCDVSSGPRVAASASWRALPEAPIPGRGAASAVWTRSEMIAWGGYGPSGSSGAMRSDGAACSPETRRWRRIARAPSGVRGGGGDGAAWTGREMVVWAGNSPDGPVGGAAYDPRTDTWRRLPDGPLGARERYTSVWTGKELLIFGGNLGYRIATPAAAAVNPRTGSWRRLRALDGFGGFMPTGGVWNGREAFVLAAQSPRAPATLVAFNPTTNRARRISLAKAPVAPGTRPRLKPVAWTGTEILFSTNADELFSSTGVVGYDPTTGRWKKGSLAPCALPIRAYTQIAWIGDRLVAACRAGGLQIYSPLTDIWRTIEPGPSPLNSRGDSAIVWTGTDLIAWSGTEYKQRNPTPATGASLTLGQ